MKPETIEFIKHCLLQEKDRRQAVMMNEIHYGMRNDVIMEKLKLYRECFEAFDDFDEWMEENEE